MAHPTNEAFRVMSDEEQTRLLQSKTDYRELYGHLKDAAGGLAGNRQTAVCWRAAAGRSISLSLVLRLVSPPCTGGGGAR